MIRRLLLILVAVTQLAALPVTVTPPTAEVGRPLIVSVRLPDATTELVGFPDLGSFALLAAPERSDNNFTLRLLPLRPGSQTLPALSFRTGQQLAATAPIELSVAAPPTPARPHPLRALPTAERDLQKHPNRSLIYLAVGFAILGIIVTVYRRRRWVQPAQPEPDLSDLSEQFAQLATTASQVESIDHPEWQIFCRRLERVRFSPLPRSQEQLQELTAEFVRLRGETS